MVWILSHLLSIWPRYSLIDIILSLNWLNILQYFHLNHNVNLIYMDRNNKHVHVSLTAHIYENYVRIFTQLSKMCSITTIYNVQKSTSPCIHLYTTGKSKKLLNLFSPRNNVQSSSLFLLFQLLSLSSSSSSSKMSSLTSSPSPSSVGSLPSSVTSAKSSWLV